MYVKVKDGVIERFPYTPSDLMRDNPNTSFPHYPSDELMAGYGMYKVVERSLPTYERRTQTVEQETVPELTDGVWVLGWQIKQKTEEEIKKYDAETERFIREERNRLLSDTDWRFCSDLNPSPEWVNYRQLLRDIPQQTGFPENVIWPSKPE